MAGPLPAGLPLLIDVLVSLTMLDVEQASTALAAAPKAMPSGVEDLRRLVNQAPLSHEDRLRLLASLDAGLLDVHAAQIATAAELVRSTMPRFPAAAGQVTLGPLDPSLTAALRLLFALDKLVETPSRGIAAADGGPA